MLQVGAADTACAWLASCLLADRAQSSCTMTGHAGAQHRRTSPLHAAAAEPQLPLAPAGAAPGLLPAAPPPAAAPPALRPAGQMWQGEMIHSRLATTCVQELQADTCHLTDAPPCNRGQGGAAVQRTAAAACSNTAHLLVQRGGAALEFLLPLPQLPLPLCRQGSKRVIASCHPTLPPRAAAT